MQFREFSLGSTAAGFAIVVMLFFFGCFYYLSTTVRFEDRRLEAAVRVAIELPKGRITTKEAAKWAKLDLTKKGFESLSGLEHFVSLQEINFSNNQILTIEPLAKLKDLRQVTLDGNRIRDLSPLSNLNSLFMLSLDNNRVIDLSPLSSLPSLSLLSLQYNPDLWDLSPGSATVAMLGVRGCNIQNLESISSFGALAYLDAGENSISRIDGIEGCPALEVVMLDANKIARLDDSAGSPSVTVLTLKNNAIRQIETLPPFPALARLELEQNNIVQLPDISALTNLKFLGLDGNPLNPAICAGADYYRKIGLEVSTDSCPDLPTIPEPRMEQQASGALPFWKRRHMEVIEENKNRSFAPGYIQRPATPQQLQRHYGTPSENPNKIYVPTIPR